MQAVKSENATTLKIWEKIRIIVGSGPEAGVYEARVEDIINGGIVVTNPEFVSGKTLLRQDAKVTVQITRTDAAYQFDSVIKQEVGGSKKRIILAPPRHVTRIQRRMFARVELSIRLKFAPCTYDADWTDWQNRFEWREGFASNISGGGLLVAMEENCVGGKLVALEVDTLREAGLSPWVLGESRRAYATEGKRFCGLQFLTDEMLENSLGQSQYRKIPSEFKDFTLRKQDRLVTYLFKQQIELRRKGLI